MQVNALGQSKGEKMEWLHRQICFDTGIEYKRKRPSGKEPSGLSVSRVQIHPMSNLKSRGESDLGLSMTLLCCFVWLAWGWKGLETTRRLHLPCDLVLAKRIPLRSGDFWFENVFGRKIRRKSRVVPHLLSGCVALFYWPEGEED